MAHIFPMDMGCTYVYIDIIDVCVCVIVCMGTTELLNLMKIICLLILYVCVGV